MTDHEHDHDHDRHDDHDHDERKHDDGHDHDHGHRGGHHHGPPEAASSAFVIGMILNLLFVVIGVIAGIVANSVALLADAAHNMGDALGLAMAWGAIVLAKRARTARRTYGLRRSTIVAALANSMLILVAIGGVVWEAIQRLGVDHPVDGGIVAVVAAIGVVINAAAAMLFAKGRKGDVNVRGAFLHLIADAAVSAGVVVSGLIVWETGWSWIDPATSLAVSAIILWSTVALFREAMDLILDAVPAHIDPAAVETYLAGLTDVRGVHDLHIWPMSTTEVALTVHLSVPWATCSPTFLRDASTQIAKRFGIAHVTIQLEPADQPEPCEQGEDGKV